MSWLRKLRGGVRPRGNHSDRDLNKDQKAILKRKRGEKIAPFLLPNGCQGLYPSPKDPTFPAFRYRLFGWLVCFVDFIGLVCFVDFVGMVCLVGSLSSLSLLGLLGLLGLANLFGLCRLSGLFCGLKVRDGRGKQDMFNVQGLTFKFGCKLFHFVSGHFRRCGF
jgi:hypothetical protein